MKNLVLGVDPGLHGAFVLLDPESRFIEAAYDMPVHEIKVGKSKKLEHDRYQLARIMDKLAERVVFAVIEKVTNSPQMGGTSSFNFGRAYEGIAQAVACQFIPMHEVTPAVWKKAMRLTQDKDFSRRRASELMPSSSQYWPLKKHDGRAEAALLAWYGLRYCQA